MADVKISALPALTSAALTDLFAVVQGGVTYKGTLQQLVDAIPDASGSVRGLVSTGTQTFAGNKTFTGESSTVGNALIVNNLGGTAKFTVANAGRVSLTSDTTVTTQTVSVITTATTNSGLVLQPNGTGAIMAQAPDGTSTGGNARGTNATDLQMERTNPTQIASGTNSAIIMGRRNTASAGFTLAAGDENSATSQWSIVLGGQKNSATTASGASVFGGFSNTASAVQACVIGGRDNTSSGTSSLVGGDSNSATASYSSVFGGYQARAVLYGQRANASGRFAATGDAQTSAITYRRSITGQTITELFLDGSSLQAILNIASPGPTNARAWRAQMDVVAIVATAGGGGLVQNECFMGSYVVGIKRVGTNTSLVGTVGVVNEVSDTNMATAVVTIDADDTNEALRIQFTPPSTADGTTVIRVVATAYLTEVGR